MGGRVFRDEDILRCGVGRVLIPVTPREVESLGTKIYRDGLELSAVSVLIPSEAIRYRSCALTLSRAVTSNRRCALSAPVLRLICNRYVTNYCKGMKRRDVNVFYCVFTLFKI